MNEPPNVLFDFDYDNISEIKKIKNKYGIELIKDYVKVGLILEEFKDNIYIFYFTGKGEINFK